MQRNIMTGTPRRGSEHIAWGRAKRHPRYNTDVDNRPERAKALSVNCLRCLCIMLLPFQGAVVCGISNPGVPLRSAPGYVLAAPAGRTRHDVPLFVFLPTGSPCLCVSVFRKKTLRLCAFAFFLNRLCVLKKVSKAAVLHPKSGAFGLQKCHFRTSKRPLLPRSQVPVSGSFRDEKGGKRSHKPRNRDKTCGNRDAKV